MELLIDNTTYRCLCGELSADQAKVELNHSLQLINDLDVDEMDEMIKELSK